MLRQAALHTLPVSVARRRTRPAPPCCHSAAKLLLAEAPAAEHDWLGHPESAARVPAVMAALQAGGLTPGGSAAGDALVYVTGSASATREQLARVHTANYLGSLSLLTARKAPCLYDGDTYLTKQSQAAAAAGVGAALALVDAVVLESRRRQQLPGAPPGPAAFALCRPPGHHALPQSAMGFCLYSTAALAARHAQAVHGLQRVLIYDWDVHHGNGTEAAFAADPDVLYISSHQAGGFPGTGELAYVGVGAGEGATINVPLPGGSGDAAARAVMDTVVGPSAERFQPDLILVSAGFDAHWRDPLAGLQWTDATYAALARAMTQLAARLCGGRIVFLLEGGYDLTGLASGCLETVRACLDLAPALGDAVAAQALLAEPDAKVAAVLREVRALHGL